MRSLKWSVALTRSSLQPSRKTLLFLLTVTWLVVSSHSDEDYYKLLGISRDASTREIRQAFKKLALTMHPDKNPMACWFIGQSGGSSDGLLVYRAVWWVIRWPAGLLDGLVGHQMACWFIGQSVIQN
ncbi:hypothetical protein NFI96_015982 [Prochilodus magdalenae]|nr:hypothetical protein NFI96_015982 [Prochilodus magdalenae]